MSDNQKIPFTMMGKIDLCILQQGLGELKARHVERDGVHHLDLGLDAFYAHESCGNKGHVVTELHGEGKSADAALLDIFQKIGKHCIQDRQILSVNSGPERRNFKLVQGQKIKGQKSYVYVPA